MLALDKVAPTSLIKDEAANWLLNARSVQFTGETSGWLVQIISETPGTCNLINTETQTEQPITVASGYTPWIEVSSDVLNENTKSLQLDCSSMSVTPTLSLLQRKSQTISGQPISVYYINQEADAKTITVEFGNPCWGRSYQSSCAQEYSS